MRRKNCVGDVRAQGVPSSPESRSHICSPKHLHSLTLSRTVVCVCVGVGGCVYSTRLMKPDFEESLDKNTIGDFVLRPLSVEGSR